jgi:hypothetical protein
MTEIVLNESRRPEIRLVGDERTPVIIIDQPIGSTEPLIRVAGKHPGFHLDRRFAYPGLRAELPDDYVDAMLPALVPMLREVYEIPESCEHRLIHRVFSVITTQPEDLAVLQRVPHFDTLNPRYFATVHYLNPGTYAGTGIFRHRPTGFERISDARYQAYVSAAEAYMKAHGLPAAQYINGTTDHYELIEEVEYRPNRLVIYPGNLLHSGLIHPDRDIDPDPSKGRLTANVFIDFVE